MKNILLPCLAAAALTLSFCFEQAPDASAPASTRPVPAAAEASLLAGLLPTEPTLPPAEAEPVARAASRDSLAYGYYGQTLGLQLSHTENKSLLQTVTDWLGTPYSYGANSRRGTDCSGFVSRVYKAVYGIKLQRSSRSMFGTVRRVGRPEMRAGDLVFFSHGKAAGGIYHVGIYLKDGKFAHAACNGGVMVSSLHEDYYRRNFYAGGRVAGTEPAAAPGTPVITPEMLATVSRLRLE